MRILENYSSAGFCISSVLKSVLWTWALEDEWCESITEVLRTLALGRSLMMIFFRTLPELYFEKIFNLIGRNGREIFVGYSHSHSLWATYFIFKFQNSFESDVCNNTSLAQYFESVV